nr:hypothetical protein [Mucilaginibacter sp. L294]
MKRAYLIFVYLLVTISARAQQPAPPYQNFVVKGDKIYLLVHGGLKIYNSADGKLEEQFKLSAKLKALYQDRLGNILTVDVQSRIKRLNADKSWSVIGNYGQMIAAVAFNSKNDCFLVTDAGIVDISTKKIYRPDSSFFHSEWSGMQTKKEWRPSEIEKMLPVFIDSYDNLWTIVDHGEWGQDLFIFSTTAKKFLNFTKAIAMPSFEFNGELFGSSGYPFSYSVVRYQRANNGSDTFYKGSIVYDTEKDEAVPHDFNTISRLSIANCTFNKFDGCLYAITSYSGLYKADPKKGIKRFSDWKKVDAFKRPVYKGIGVVPSTKDDRRWQPEYISKIRFAENGNLILLSPDRGMRIFNGKTLIIVK